MPNEIAPLPSPIAFALARVAQEPTEQRLPHLVAATERTVRFLTLVSASRHLNRKPTPRDPAIDRALGALAWRASFGTWKDALLAVEGSFGSDPTFAVPLDQKLKLPHALDLYRRKHDCKSSKISAKQALCAFVELRNDLVHPRGRGLTETEKISLTRILERALREVVDALDIANCSVPMFVKRADKGPSWKVETINFLGATKPRLQTSEHVEAPPDLVHSGALVLAQHGRPMFSLSPLFVARDNQLYLLQEFPGGKPVFESADPELGPFDPNATEIARHFEEVVGHLVRVPADSPVPAADVLQTALTAARADGVITPDELAMLEAIQRRFSLPALDLSDHELAHRASPDTEAEDEDLQDDPKSAAPNQRPRTNRESAPSILNMMRNVIDQSMMHDAPIDQARELASGMFESAKILLADPDRDGALDWNGWEALESGADLDFDKGRWTNTSFRLEFERNSIPLVLEVAIGEAGSASTVRLLFDAHELTVTEVAVNPGELPTFAMRLPYEGTRQLTIDRKSSQIRIRTGSLLVPRQESCPFEAFVRR